MAGVVRAKLGRLARTLKPTTSWQAQQESFEELEHLLREGARETPAFLDAVPVHEVVDALLPVFSTHRRRTVVCSALRLISCLASLMKSRFEQHALRLLPSLTSLQQCSAEPDVARMAFSTICDIIENCVAKRIMKAVADACTLAQRRNFAPYLVLILQKWDVATWTAASEEIFEKFFLSVAKATFPDVWARAREAFSIYHSHKPSRAQALFESLDARLQKELAPILRGSTPPARRQPARRVPVVAVARVGINTTSRPQCTQLGQRAQLGGSGGGSGSSSSSSSCCDCGSASDTKPPTQLEGGRGTSFALGGTLASTEPSNRAELGLAGSGAASSSSSPCGSASDATTPRHNYQPVGHRTPHTRRTLPPPQRVPVDANSPAAFWFGSLRTPAVRITSAGQRETMSRQHWCGKRAGCAAGGNGALRQGAINESDE